MMVTLLDNCLHYIWHAFAALQTTDKLVVQKSKLKVLTANIGTLLDLYGVERGLDHFRSTNHLTFEHYIYYLKCEVFNSLPKTLTASEIRCYETKIAEICWLVCKKRYVVKDPIKEPKYFQRDPLNDFAKDPTESEKHLSSESLYQLFRIFCMLGETCPEKYGDETRLHPSEALWVLRTLVTSLGLDFDEDDWTQLTECAGLMKFAMFVTVIEAKCLNDDHCPEGLAVSEAIADMYKTLIQDVIKKGYLYKRGYLLPTLREYWFVLQPSELSYYKTRTEKEKCGFLLLDQASRVELQETGNRFNLVTNDGTFDLAATDSMSRQQWTSALKLAADYSGNPAGYQRALALKRRQNRLTKHGYEMAKDKELLQERAARQAAEGRVDRLQTLANDEAKRIVELEAIKTKLERLLEEETQAKRDEETVRALQARVLAEEWEKREELERIQEEHKLLLQIERSKRHELERRQRNAEEKLKMLEEERKKLDRQIKSAHSKIEHSEESRAILEAQLRNPSLVNRSLRMTRAQSFIPSTREKPVMIEVRPQTLQKPQMKAVTVTKNDL